MSICQNSSNFFLKKCNLWYYGLHDSNAETRARGTKMQVNDSCKRAEKHQPYIMKIFTSRPACTKVREWGRERAREGDRETVSRETWWFGYPLTFLYRKGKKNSQEPPLSHAERCSGMPEVQRRLAGMKSFASGANRRLLFISSAYRFAVVIFGDAEGHLKEFLMGLWCEKQGDLLRRCSLLILNELISQPLSV